MNESGDNGILIVEKACEGHHLVYVRLLVEAALDKGHWVTLATTARVLSDERFFIHMGSVQGRIQIIEIDQTVSLSDLQQLGRFIGVSKVLVPDALPYSKDLLVGQRLKAPELRLLVMNDPRWALEGASKPQPRQIAKLVFLWLASWRRGQEIFWLRPPGHEGTGELFVCDPVVIDAEIGALRTGAAELRVRLGMDGDTFWFGLVGGVGEWKNPSMVVESCIAVNAATDRRLGLLIAGPWRARQPFSQAASALREGGVTLATQEGYLTNDELNEAVAALDCLVLAYSTSAPNSTAGKAAALGVRVVAAGSPAFRRFAQEIAGVQGVPLNKESLIRGMSAAVMAPAPKPRLGFGTAGFTDPLLASVTRGRKDSCDGSHIGMLRVCTARLAAAGASWAERLMSAVRERLS